jgi:hypothetical protein
MQELFVTLALGLAIAFIGLRTWKRFRKKSSCDNCALGKGSSTDQ